MENIFEIILNDEFVISESCTVRIKLLNIVIPLT